MQSFFHILGRLAASCLLGQAALLMALRLSYRDSVHVGVQAEISLTAERLFVLDAKLVPTLAQASMTRSC